MDGYGEVHREDLAVALREGHCIALSWFGAYSGILPFALGNFMETLALALKTPCLESNRAYLIEDRATSQRLGKLAARSSLEIRQKK